MPGLKPRPTSEATATTKEKQQQQRRRSNRNTKGGHLTKRSFIYASAVRSFGIRGKLAILGHVGRWRSKDGCIQDHKAQHPNTRFPRRGNAENPVGQSPPKWGGGSATRKKTPYFSLRKGGGAGGHPPPPQGEGTPPPPPPPCRRNRS